MLETMILGTGGAGAANLIALGLLALALLTLAVIALRSRRFSFRAQKPAHYAGTSPAFDPLTALNGPMACDGVIFGPNGRVISRFNATMEGRWTGRTGTLAEHFRYDSGSEQDRLWTLTLHEGGRLTATADDILGTGTGQASGATLNLNYRLRLPPQAGGHVLDVTDWLYLMPDGTIMNRSQMSRFGLPLAELVATMRPAPAPAPALSSVTGATVAETTTRHPSPHPALAGG